MASPKPYVRDAAGIRFTPGGMNTTRPTDALAAGEYAFLQNVRAYLQDRIVSRNQQSTPLFTIPGATAIHSTRRLNDTTPAGPVSGYTLISGNTSGTLAANATQVVTGLTGNPVSLIPFRPNTSVQPWMYVGDASLTAHIISPAFDCAGMVKVRSDNLTYKTGIAEPQTPPTITTASTTTTGNLTVPATARPWSNVGGINSTYNYGDNGNGSAPILIATPIAGSTLTITVTGTATVNGATHSPGDSGPTTSGYPGQYILGAAIIVGAFTDAAGLIVASGAVPVVVSVGASATLIVPPNATRFQLGIDSMGGAFSGNSGSFTAVWTLTTSAIATKASLLGNVTAYYWGDSPTSGPVSAYIWKNPNDTYGSGTPRSIGTASGSSTNNSLIFDSTPEDGTVPVQWTTLNSDGTVGGSQTLFSPALSSTGYQDFNVCVTGNLFIPAPGDYTLTVTFKDGILLGIGAGATWAGKGTTYGNQGQSITVVSSLPLVPVAAPDGASTTPRTTTITITFPQVGVYPIELDWDYWYHSGRKLILQLSPTPGAAVATIPPLPSGVRTNVSYVGVYRSSATGATSNPSPASLSQSTPVLDSVVSLAFSPDPQVDKIDYYRQDSGLPDFTYVATGPNTNPPTAITDTLTDLAAVSNQLLQRDNFEPFPSIDLPRAGVVNVVGGEITWVSGDTFNTRWLPGTVILLGAPTQLAYSLYSRPASTTAMYIPDVPDGNGQVYNIAEPILAAQPMPSLWGPTDNTAFMFGCGDPLRPGTLYFTKGNNPDSAPDTNQIEVTSPSEPLMNGVIVNGIGMVFSTERAWLIYPTFTTALATVSGVSGSQFNLIESITDRGLYCRACVCVEGGRNVFFRAKDGIYASPGGSGSQSLTDSTIYNLFPHEGSTPSPVAIGPFTVYPPDDTQPEHQRLSFADGYLYYDYLSLDGTPRTLVYDVVAKGWSVDAYADPVTVHMLEEGASVNGVLVGTVSGKVRTLVTPGSTSASESGATAIIASASLNAGDSRALKVLGDVFAKANIPTGSGVSLAFYQSRYGAAITGFTPASFIGTGALSPYLFDFTSSPTITDVSIVCSWNLGVGAILDLWQPNFRSLPESTEDRATDWDDLGTAGNKFIQGFLLEANTSGASKLVVAQRSDDLATFTPAESPAVWNGQSIKAFSFSPPFLAHSVRRISSDGIPWQAGPDDGWRMEWVFKPYPESATNWETEGISHGRGFQHLYQVNLAYRSTAPVTLVCTTDAGTFSQVWPATGIGINPAKVLLKMPANKWKIISYRLSCAVPFYLWRDDTEVWVKTWGSVEEYALHKPFGGASSSPEGGAEV